MDSNSIILSKRYARAYMEAGVTALTAKDVSEAELRVERLKNIAAGLKPYNSTLNHPAVSAAVKIEILGRIIPERDAAWNFLCLLIQHGRFSLLEEIIKSCSALLDKVRGIIRAEVSAPFTLPEPLIERMKKLISPDTSKVVLKQITDKETIGGFELRTGDMVLDATLRGRLRALEKEFEA
jgi:F-type H+-transporting ATPase subunit delta